MSGNRGAPLRFCSGERDAPQFFPCLLRGTTSAAQRLSGTDSSARCQLFWMNAGLFHLVFWRRDHARSSLPWLFKGRHALFSFTIFFPTRFQQNAGRAFRARRPQGALFGRGRLTERESRLPFSSSTPFRNQSSLHARGGLLQQGETFLYFFQTWTSLWGRLKKMCATSATGLGWFTQMVFDCEELTTDIFA